MIHPLEHGHIFSSPGSHFNYRVIGACCRLFDREQLPYPCCRLQWRSKEPSWRRIGKRFVLDMATRSHPTYSVEILEQGRRYDQGDVPVAPLLLTVYWVKLPQLMNEWWYSDRLRQVKSLTVDPPSPTADLVTSSKSFGSAEETKIEG